MISKSDWQKAYDEILDEGRTRLPPPTFEQAEALRSGRLPEEEAEQVREAFAYYPELLRVLTEPVPDEPGSVVTEEEVAFGLAALKERIAEERDKARPDQVTHIDERRPSRRIFAWAAAAAIVLVGGAIVLSVTNRVEGTPVLLTADGELSGSQGGQTPHQLSTGTDYLLQPAFRPERDYPSYRLELFDLSGDVPRTIESWRDAGRAPDGTFPVELSTKGFAEGRYQLVLYGVEDSPVPLATYTIRLTAP